MSFKDDLAAASAAPKDYADAEVTVNGTLYTLRFEQMDPVEWASEVDKHPARPNVLLDMRYGYFLRSLVKAVAPLTGKVLDGDEFVDVEDWPALFKSIGGYGMQRVTDAIWAVNERGPEMAVEAAKKARAASEKSST